MRNKIIFYSLALTLLMTSCATIISSSKQNVKFSSNPSNATIFINEFEVGKTPFDSLLPRKSDYNVMIKLEGYQTYNIKLTRKTNGWCWANLVFGGIIGIIVDAITGAIYRLSPDQIDAQMNKGTAFKSNRKDIYIAVALNIDPSWKKIGQFEKVAK